MIKSGNSLAILLFGVLTFALTSNADATSHVKGSITTEATYQLDSDQAERVKAWLVEHAAYVNGTIVGDPDKFGSVQVAYTSKSAAGSARPMDINRPPIPLPMTGNPGDVMSITSTSGGVTQTWTYTWVGNSAGGSWPLRDYTYHQNKPPTDPK